VVPAVHGEFVGVWNTKGFGVAEGDPDAGEPKVDPDDRDPDRPTEKGFGWNENGLFVVAEGDCANTFVEGEPDGCVNGVLVVTAAANGGAKG
jgi:hypothetical protein